MKELILLIERFPYTARTTSGKLYMVYDGGRDFFCFTLEDTARPYGVKVYGETCLPEGDYKIGLFENEHYKKTLILHTEDDGVTIKQEGIKFVGCLFHGGIDHTHTEGCILVGKNRVTNDSISGSMKDALRIFVERKMNEGYTVKCQIINLSQSQ